MGTCKKTTYKTYTCGLKDRQPGENLWNSILQFANAPVSVVGIPNHLIPDAIEIMKEALSPEEIALLKMGFGLGTERMSQKEIGEMLNMDKGEVSRRMAEAVQVLSKRTGIRRKLESLVPATTELYEAFKNRQNNTAMAERAEKDARAIAGYKAGIKERDSKVAKLGEALEQKEQETAALRKRLENAESENQRLRAEILHLTAEKTQLSTSFDKIRSVFEDVRAASVEISSSKLEKLFGCNSDVVSALKRVGINDLDALCNNSKKNLIDLRVSQAFVSVIEQKLAERGLKLRT
ncbi:hypothetical protein IKT18_00590 [Candidatus Saccharibacteria bacterium]|nr:hypothetical protein [Candidatus Saccharibacteria bacterium]